MRSRALLTSVSTHILSSEAPVPDFAPLSNADQFEVFAHLMLALVLGALIGMEREYRGHEAGVRTSALVCLGAALFGHTSLLYGDSRVAAGVVQGIGFLGAGLIFQRGPDVRGVRRRPRSGCSRASDLPSPRISG